MYEINVLLTLFLQIEVSIGEIQVFLNESLEFQVVFQVFKLFFILFCLFFSHFFICFCFLFLNFFKYTFVVLFNSTK